MLQISQPEAMQQSVTEIFKTATIDIKGMKCGGCVKAVERQLIQNEGVLEACVNLVTSVATLKYNPEKTQPEILATRLTEKGFPSQPRDGETGNFNKLIEITQTRKQENQQQLWNLTLATILILGSILGHLNHFGGPSFPIVNQIWFHWSLATLAIFLPGRLIIIDGFRSLWHQNPNMNTLISIGALSAYLTSCIALLFPQLGWECFFDEPIMLLGFILLGKTLQSRAKNKASSALEALMALQPPQAVLISSASIDETGIKIPVEEVRLGEFVKVLPGEKMPVDGEIVDGKTSLDESMLTGESIPVVKQPGDMVIAGTMNLNGVIAVKTTRTGKDTTLAEIIESVESAQTKKAPIQQLADTVAGYFTYGVMAMATLTFLFWYFIGSHLWQETVLAISPSSLLLSLKMAIATLVIACPCALGLATPTAILVGTSVGAERGILIKGGDILEVVHKLDTVIFDKTGTLTIGYPIITDCLPKNGVSKERLLQLAASIEKGTNHPLAQAIVSAALEEDISLLTATDIYTEIGLGVCGVVEGEQVLVGNAPWLASQGINLDNSIIQEAIFAAQQGKTIVYVAYLGKIIGLIALADQIRPDAVETVSKLQKLGIKVMLLTGDNPLVAKKIASSLGIQEFFANLKPDDKVSTIQSLKDNSKSKVIAMVGDGINDAPAIATADIGIALQMGTEVAIESAGIVLMGNRLLDVVNSIKLSRATFNKIRQNLFWALGYNTFAIPIAAGFLLPSLGVTLSPATAGIFMAFSSVMVVTNSLFLRNFQPVIINYDKI